MRNRASLDPIVWSSFALLMLVFGLLGFALAQQTATENATLKQDLTKAQARLDEFYDPAKHVVTLDGLKLKAIPELGRADAGYLVLRFYPVGFSGSGTCGAGFENGSQSRWTPVGGEFPCPDFVSHP